MSLFKAASTVSLLTLVSRITGLARELLIASTFGASAMTDAFNVAFRIPNLFRRLFAEGAFSQAFVPVLAASKAKHGEEATRLLIDRVATVLTCLTGLPIFQHGGFGPPHALAIITLVVLAIVWAAANTGVFGSWSRYVEVLGLSLTVFFHWVPAVTETSSRLPLDAPLTTGPTR